MSNWDPSDQNFSSRFKSHPAVMVGSFALLTALMFVIAFGFVFIFDQTVQALKWHS
ncbi:MAG: hypothetical protein K2X27_19580 [Candidatus Obscuribacterales bacterium]|nr:hypothetical protein [Candidatus Obscuribacterales bacterium]